MRTTTSYQTDAPDYLYDCSSAHLAEVFGRRTVEMMRSGRDPFVAARMAFSFADHVLAQAHLAMVTQP